MPKFSEETFNTWRRPPSDTEESKLVNAQKQVRDCIFNDANLRNLTIETFAQGSYANDTNVRLNSDVDVNVMYKDECYFQLPQGKTNEDYGIVLSNKLAFFDYKNMVENALVNSFGRSNVKRNNKCIKVLGSSTRVECDVVPTFLYESYLENGSHVDGVKFLSDDKESILGFPKQHIQNAIEKNTKTGKKFKRATRIFKRLRYRMKDELVSFPDSVTSFLLESLIWNVPNTIFIQNNSWTDIVKESIIHIHDKTKFIDGCKDWGEVSEQLYLFHNGRKWSFTDVNNYMLTLWRYLDF